MSDSSLDRMLGILDLFREDNTAITQEDVIKHIGCSRATAYRYLKSLSSCGLLTPASGGAYVLGSRVIEFDRLLRMRDPLVIAARDVMTRVAARLKTNLMLCSYYGDKVMCVDRVWEDSSIESSYERGRPMPMFAGATAKSILANLSPYQLRNLMLWHADEIRAAGLGNDWDSFRDTMKRLRKEGVYVSFGEVDKGLIGIGAPIFGHERKVLGSLVFIVSTERTSAKRLELLKREVKDAAAEISAKLDGSISVGGRDTPALASRTRRVRA